MERTLTVNFQDLVAALDAATQGRTFDPPNDDGTQLLMDYVKTKSPIGNVSDQAALIGRQTVKTALSAGIVPTPEVVMHYVFLALYATGIMHGWYVAQQRRDVEMRALLGVED